MIRIKEGASLQGLQIEMRNVLIAIEAAYESIGQIPVITCGTDGEHSAGSYHYYGYAVDVRTRNLMNDEVIQVMRELDEALPDPYDISDEGTHIHIEYDYEKALQREAEQDKKDISSRNGYSQDESEASTNARRNSALKNVAV